MRLVAALALGAAITLGLPVSTAQAKRQSVQTDQSSAEDGDQNSVPSATCSFSKSRTIGNNDPSRSLAERCENRSSEMCIFGFGTRGFKPRQNSRRCCDSRSLPEDFNPRATGLHQSPSRPS